MWCKFDGLQLELSQTNIDEVGTELKQLEEKLHLWREVRQKTIAELRLHWQGRQTDRDSQGCRVWWLGPGWRPHPGRGRDDCPHRGRGAACPPGAGLGLASGLTGASAALYCSPGSKVMSECLSKWESQLRGCVRTVRSQVITSSVFSQNTLQQFNLK